MKFHIFTFGCQMNVHDSSWLSRALRSRGWEEVAEDEASVFVINTCSVRDKPEQKVYSQLGRLAAYAKDKPELFMAVGDVSLSSSGRDFSIVFHWFALYLDLTALPMHPTLWLNYLKIQKSA